MQKTILYIIILFQFSCGTNKLTSKNNILFKKEINTFIDYINYNENRFNLKMKLIIITQVTKNEISIGITETLGKKRLYYFKYRGKYFLISINNILIKQNNFLGFNLHSVMKNYEELKINSNDYLIKDYLYQDEREFVYYNFIKNKINLTKTRLLFLDKYLEFKRNYSNDSKDDNSGNVTN